MHIKFNSEEPLTHTVMVIKPDAVAAGRMSDILREAEKEFIIADLVLTKWATSTGEAFYRAHRDKTFYRELVEFMTSGPLLVGTLVGHNAVTRWREMMGATDPMKAEEGTIRAQFSAKDGIIMHNAVHGSDSDDAAYWESALIRERIQMGFGHGALRVISSHG